MVHRILVIDDDPAILDLVQLELEQESYEIVRAESASEGIERISDSRPNAIILDLHLPDRPGHEVLEYCARTRPQLPVVILTGAGGAEEAVKCMSQGASDFVEKPFDRARLVTSLANALSSCNLKKQLQKATDELLASDGFDAIIGSSPQISQSIDLLRRASLSDVTVLISGESGTGKEVAARALHAESDRRRGPFVAVNCGAIPESLIESELFGHVEGAFTGAVGEREGRFEQADGGTIFLDEIGELRVDLQVRLLRVLQEHCVRRVGGGATTPIDVRVIAATNKDLKTAMQDNEFREDLFYRLAVFPVELPPLRDRDGDLKLLVAEFLKMFSKRHGKGAPQVESGAWLALCSHSWPGNIRELMNVIERSIILEDSDFITIDSLPDELVCRGKDADTGYVQSEDDFVVPFVSSAPKSDDAARVQEFELCDLDLEETEILPFNVQESRIIRNALVRCDWNVKLAAEKLGLGRATVYRKIEKYDLIQNPANL